MLRSALFIQDHSTKRMKLLTTLAISKAAFGQVPDGGWVTGPNNIDTSLKTCGFFDIGKTHFYLNLLRQNVNFRRWLD